MESVYRILFKVNFFHEFYKNDDDEYTHLDEDIKVLPTDRCQREMINQGLLFRTTPGSFTVLYRGYVEDGVEKPLIPLTEARPSWTTNMRTL